MRRDDTYAVDGVLGLTVCSPEELRKPLRELLAEGRVALVKGHRSHWIVAGRLEKPLFTRNCTGSCVHAV